MLQRDWIIGNSFSKVSRLFSHITQSVLLVRFKRNNVLRRIRRRRILNFKSISPYSWAYGEVTFLFIKWMTSQAYNNNDVLLFLLQIWKQPRRIKCSDQFRVNKRDTDCFEYLHEENTKPLVNVSVWHAWIFLSTSAFVWFLQRGGKEWRNSNRIGEGCWYSCGYFLPLILVEKSVVQLRPSARRKHIERSYFSSMASGTDLDLHLQFANAFT